MKPTFVLRRLALRLALLVATCAPAFAQTSAWTTARTNVAGVVSLYEVAFGNGRFVATVGGFVSIIWSSDGVTWTPVPAVSGLGNKILFIGGSFYVIGNAQIWRSTEGETWSRVTAATVADGGAHSLAATDGRGLLTASSTGASAGLLFSADMSTFTPAAPLPDLLNTSTSINAISSVTYGAGRYFVSYIVAPAPGVNTTGYIVSTTDGSRWTRVATGATSGFYTAGTKDRWLAFVDNIKSLTTTDGTTIAINSIPFTIGNFDNLVTAGGRFFMSRTLTSSLNGVTWAPLANAAAVPLNADLRSYTYGKGRYLGVGYASPPTGAPLDLIVSLTAPAAPVFSTPPLSRTVTEGQAVSLSATLDNPDFNTTFQWRHDGVLVPGATLPTLTLASPRLADAGLYTVEARNALGVTRSDPALLTVVPFAQAGRIVNLSVLTSLDAADSFFTVGFVLGGRDSIGAKSILVRAVGPSLAPFGVGNPVADPKLELLNSGVKLAENDNWGGAFAIGQATAQVGAFGFLSSSSTDAALATSVPKGDSIVRVSANGGATGAVLAEVYDATPANAITGSTPRLINVSILKNLPAGATISAGFVIGGSTPRNILMRVIGPALGAFGVVGAHPDPKLTLYQSGVAAAIAANENWGGTADLAAAFTAVGAFSLEPASKDAALLATLAPGNYSVQATAPANTSGYILVEVYEAP